MTTPTYKAVYNGYEIEIWEHCTNIFNVSNRSRIGYFPLRGLPAAEAEKFIDGYICGLEAGKQIGQMEEGERIRKVLGI